MIPKIRKALLFVFLSFACYLASAIPALAEPYIYVYTGQASTDDSNLRIIQPSLMTDVTFSGVSYDDESFDDPLYYGYKLGYALSSITFLAFELEFFHYKVIAETSEVVSTNGTLSGASISTNAPLNNTVQKFEITDGINFVTFNVVGRHGFIKTDQFPNGRIQPYVGVGVGIVISHGDSIINGMASRGPYQVDDDPAVQLFAGLRAFPIDLGISWGNPALFTEYKFTTANPDVDVDQGNAGISADTHHFIFGFGWHF